jgi:prolyl-tRNA synthetase
VKNCLVVVDDCIPDSPNLVAGANEEGYHYLNVNYGRDYQAAIVADIVTAQEGDLSPRGGGPMITRRGVEVGNIFKLGPHFTDSLGASYLDENGQAQSVVMGSYGVGVGRLLACVAEEYNDDQGLIWPISIAPYQLHLVNLSKNRETADQLFNDLLAAGVEVLYDDRQASPGVKFNDADLIGLPLRLTVGDRSLKKGGVELQHRTGGDRNLVPLNEVVSTVKAEIEGLFAEIEATVVEVPFEDA